MAHSNGFPRWYFRDRRNGLYVGLAFSLLCGGAIYLAPYFASLRQKPLRIEMDPIQRRVGKTDTYGGAVIFVSPGSDNCTRVSFDNKTGKLSDGIKLPCDDAVQELAEQKMEQSAASTRLEAISRAIRGLDSR